MNSFRAGKSFQLIDRYLRPLGAGKGKAFQEQEGFNAALGGAALLNEGITQLKSSGAIACKARLAHGCP